MSKENSQPAEQKELVTVGQFLNEDDVLDIKDEKGREAKALLLSGDRICIVRKGTGQSVEDALFEIGKDQKKMISAMMSKVTTIDGVIKNMYELNEEPMGDYLKIQGVFSELNF